MYLKLVNVMTKSPSKDTAHKTYMKMVNNFSISSSHFRLFWSKDFPTIQPKLFFVNYFIRERMRLVPQKFFYRGTWAGMGKTHMLTADWRRIRG